MHTYIHTYIHAHIHSSVATHGHARARARAIMTEERLANLAVLSTERDITDAINLDEVCE